MEYILFAAVAAAVSLIVFVHKGTVLEDGKCPKCRHPLTLREGKFGQFWGCTNYPACKYTRKALRSK